MTEVVSCEEPPSEEFASLTPPGQECDEPLPPYKIIPPVYDGHFTDTCPQIDAVSHSRCLYTVHCFRLTLRGIARSNKVGWTVWVGCGEGVSSQVGGKVWDTI